MEIGKERLRELRHSLGKHSYISSDGREDLDLKHSYEVAMKRTLLCNSHKLEQR